MWMAQYAAIHKRLDAVRPFCHAVLSDPESYDGGELVVNDTFGQHRVKRRRSGVVSSSSLHCVTPVTRGASGNYAGSSR